MNVTDIMYLKGLKRYLFCSSLHCCHLLQLPPAFSWVLRVVLHLINSPNPNTISGTIVQPAPSCILPAPWKSRREIQTNWNKTFMLLLSPTAVIEVSASQGYICSFGKAHRSTFQRLWNVLAHDIRARTYICAPFGDDSVRCGGRFCGARGADQTLSPTAITALRIVHYLCASLCARIIALCIMVLVRLCAALATQLSEHKNCPAPGPPTSSAYITRSSASPSQFLETRCTETIIQVPSVVKLAWIVELQYPSDQMNNEGVPDFILLVLFIATNIIIAIVIAPTLRY